MAGLKSELDEYLSRNDTKPLLKSALPTSMSVPKLGNWFKKSDSSQNLEQNEWWYSGTQKSDCCPSMTRMQRITGFCLCICMGGFCFTLSAMYIPVLLLKARKFALLFTMGSLFFMCSFSFLWGPLEHIKHLFSKERLLFTLCYLSSLFATLYFALIPRSTPLTLLFGVAQVISLLWFIVSYLPGGQTGLKLFTKLFSKSVSTTVSNTLPV
ncbi:uncharacterized protein LOC142318331 [Lycorma delicatula]|uniref:uncharacterized protein LOC142318331 n=1 Tax=Lycorma delicatula TaxID=130591 RepID=UPI003F510D2C